MGPSPRSALGSKKSKGLGSRALNYVDDCRHVELVHCTGYCPISRDFHSGFGVQGLDLWVGNRNNGDEES